MEKSGEIGQDQSGQKRQGQPEVSPLKIAKSKENGSAANNNQDQNSPYKRKFGQDAQKRLQIIKEMNGFKDKVFNNPSKIESIELVLEDLEKMNVVSYFKNLKQITLINVNVHAIEGLEELYSLEALWLDENKIQKIEGLQNCTNLKRLYISNNDIRAISGLNTLVNLEVLWLCCNKIETLANLENLVNLKQFWIAGNLIEEIKISLDNLQQLTDINIAGNKICSFKEALNLNRLQNLKILSFYDPHFGENPICNLCNYQTYVLYHLRNITKLDTLFISEEAKNFAEATFMKKKMYYNMRIKTIQRTFSTLTKLAKKSRKIKLDYLNEDISNIQLKMNQLINSNHQKDNQEFNEFKELYEDKLEEISHVEEVYQSLKRKLYDTNKLTIRKLITELETGGNIRLEEGKLTDKWYVSCVDLIKSRFNSDDMLQYGIQDIQVRRVVRIHNRFLRNKFEDKMETLLDVSNANYKKSLEYLFYGTDPSSPQEIYHIIEEGFRSYKDNVKLGLSGYSPLVNSIMGADSARIYQFLKNDKNLQKFQKKFIKRKFPQGLVVLPPGQILICKVLVIKSQQDSENPYFDPTKSASDTFQKSPINSTDYQEDTVVFRLVQNDPKHKMSFFLDNNLVLPEYLVEFDYILRNNLQSKIADFGDNIGVLDNMEDEFISPKNIDIYKSEINNIYNTLCDEINNYQFENIEDLNHPNLSIKAQDLERAEINTMKITLLNYFKYCLSRSLLYELNPNLLTEVPEDHQPTEAQLLNGQSPKDIYFLNLSNMKLSTIQVFPNLQNLTHLVLSYNKILSIQNLDSFVMLTSLDLSHNEISSIGSGLAKLQNLESFDISHNNLESVQDLRSLELNQQLTDLKIFLNPVTENKTIHAQIIKFLPKLKLIDNKKVSSLNLQIQNEDSVQTITDKLLMEYEKSLKTSALKSDNDWHLSLEIVNLTHMKIRKMSGLEKLVNLRQLLLGHNQISKIECLHRSKLLEELSLEKNHIQKIEGLEENIYLKKIELGKNFIHKIEGISHLCNLMQLSLEDNNIDSLGDFPELKNLMELYLGNNRISESKEVNILKGCPKLIILDLSGNPFSRDPNYRIYTLFVMVKLKVLDGISIEPSEQQLAKDLFTGRLTEEILNSKLQGQNAADVTELDLSNCKLRDFDDVFNNNHFPNLAELNLSQNLFQSTRMIGFLPSLKILILNSNKIESLFQGSDIGVKKHLNGCQNLEILDLSNNVLKDFNGLQFCLLRELKILKAYRNEITRVDCLEQLKQLKELDVNHNKIRQLDPLSFVGSNPIKCLKINYNSLKNFNNIQKLYKLQHLFANSNRISDIPDLDRLAELQYLKELEMNGNALSRRPGYRQAVLKKLPCLLYLDGKEVTIDERERNDLLTNGMERGNLPNIHIATMVQTKGYNQVPVKLNSINFEGVFSKR